MSCSLGNFLKSHFSKLNHNQDDNRNLKSKNDYTCLYCSKTYSWHVTRMGCHLLVCSDCPEIYKNNLKKIWKQKHNLNNQKLFGNSWIIQNIDENIKNETQENSQNILKNKIK